MNDKDKEAFRLWAGEEEGESLLYDGAAFHTWQAACEYKKDEIKELSYFKAIYNSLIDGAARDTEKINKLQDENKKLREALEFYANKDNWENYSDEIYPCYIKIKNDCDLNFYGGDKAREALKEVGK